MLIIENISISVNKLSVNKERLRDALRSSKAIDASELLKSQLNVELFGVASEVFGIKYSKAPQSK